MNEVKRSVFCRCCECNWKFRYLFGEEEMKTVRIVVCMVVMLGFCAIAGAARIPVVGVTESSGVAPLYPWENLINDSGMSGDTRTLADTNSRGDYGDGMGLTNGYPVANLVFDLGQDYDLDEMWVWNYSDHGPTVIFGMQYIQIYIQAEGGPDVAAGYVQVGTHDGTAANAVDLIHDFNGATARYVKFFTAGFPDHNWSGGVYNYCGLGEVRFYEVPEPATMTLLGLAGLLGLRRRR